MQIFKHKDSLKFHKMQNKSGHLSSEEHGENFTNLVCEKFINEGHLYENIDLISLVNKYFPCLKELITPEMCYNFITQRQKLKRTIDNQEIYFNEYEKDEIIILEFIHPLDIIHEKIIEENKKTMYVVFVGFCEEESKIN